MPDAGSTTMLTCQVCGACEHDWLLCAEDPCPQHYELVDEIWVRQKAAASDEQEPTDG